MDAIKVLHYTDDHGATNLMAASQSVSALKEYAEAEHNYSSEEGEEGEEEKLVWDGMIASDGSGTFTITSIPLLN